MSVAISRRESDPLILVVDDDRRVRELLEIAFGANGFRVITAADGEEAMRRAVQERPDLIVLDVRLPKKSGIEVCEQLRREPEVGEVPIVLVSAASENETRLLGFQRGADDYLAKPFSPRELLARVRRLLARTQDLRATRERLVRAERELAHAREETQRLGRSAERSREMSELVRRAAQELERAPDLETAGARLLAQAHARIPLVPAVLLVRGDGTLAPATARGARLESLASVEIAADGELARMLAGLDRPAFRHDLEHLPELALDLHRFAAARLDLLAPVRAGNGLEALIAFGEPRRGGAPPRAALDALAALCEIAGPALAHAARERARAVQALELALDPPDERSVAAAERVGRAARELPLPPRWRELARLGTRAGSGAGRGETACALERAVKLDTTGFLADLARVIARAGECASCAGPAEIALPPTGEPELEIAAELVAAGWEHVAAGCIHDRERAAGPRYRPSVARALDRGFSAPS